MKRRDFSKLILAAAAGILAGATSGCESDEIAPPPHPDPHACAGKNTCRGNGGCATGDGGCRGLNSCTRRGGCRTEFHTCRYHNVCKGMGGCRTDKNACRGLNACKCQGGCRIDPPPAVTGR